VSEAAGSLSHHFLPQHHFVESHALPIRAEPGRILDIVERLDVADDRLIAFFIALREAPGRLAARLGLRSAFASRSFGLSDFLPLGREGDREVCFGLAGRFWRADYGLDRPSDAPAFRTWSAPGSARLVIDFVAEPREDHVMLRTQTRVFCIDAEARRRFLPYWLLIRPVSGLIRRRLLAAIRRRAEGAATP